MDIEMGQQLAGVAGVFGGNQGGFPQNAQRAQRDVLEIADRRALRDRSSDA